MADYKVESITDVRVADESSSVRLEVAAGAEQVALTIDWRIASQLIDRMALVNNEIRHSLSVPDWRAQRIKTGCHRAGVGVAVLLLLPVLYGLWLWVLGQLDSEAWKLVLRILARCPGRLWGDLVHRLDRVRVRRQTRAEPAGAAAECLTKPDLRAVGRRGRKDAIATGYTAGLVIATGALAPLF